MSASQPAAEHLRGAIDLSSLVNRGTAPGAPGAGAPAAPGGPGVAPAQGGTVEVPSLVLEGSDANFSQFLDLSMQVPVLVDLFAGTPTKGLSQIVESYGGRLLLVTVDVTVNVQLRQAFQVQSVPAAVALVGGRPLQLFAGALPEDQVRQVLEQVLQAAAQSGITGSASASAAAEDAEPVEPPLPPLHAEAYEAIEQGDYPRAITAYETAIAQNPTDKMAVAGLAQVSLLHRLRGKTIDQIRAAAAANPDDLNAQLDVADLDLSGGHVEDAFDRLLTRFETADADDRNTIRTRLLELFEVAGLDDPRVMRARARLTNLLF
ncbi:tetratricopeptide repeat protein [Mycetocola sp.]|jgi:putative thioredoxin|uniref:tetratricopeptide repeat protein n=1 Tax=Mycetocola sp. TaxID=1871042 RepID=UPI00262E0D18|nr:tetratricopeptide repeat protein [Mycetocola sp.]MCU1560332.1 co-chaperone YbbN [Mycetocola sp.]